MHSQKIFEDFSLFIFGQIFNHMSIEPCWTVLCRALLLGMLTSSFSIQIREAYISESLCRKKLQSLPVCRRRPKSQRKNRKCHHAFERRESNQEKTTQFLIPFQFLWTLFFPQKKHPLRWNLNKQITFRNLSLHLTTDFIQEPAD